MKAEDKNLSSVLPFGEEMIEDLQISVEGTQAAIGKMLERLDNAERELGRIKQIMKGGTTKGAERALILNEAVRKKGYLNRPEVSAILDCHHSEGLRAMREAAEMFQDLQVIKNSRKRWVLAVMD